MIHYSFHKNQSLNPILSQMNPAHNLTPHSSEIHFNIIFKRKLVSPSGLFPSGFLAIIFKITQRIDNIMK